MTTREPKLLNIADGTLSEAMMEGFKWRGFEEPCRLAVVCPVRPTSSENVIGFLVIGKGVLQKTFDDFDSSIGLNPRRPYDKDYQGFISLLSSQLATSLASVTLFEAEIRRAKEAEMERSRLSEELAVQRSRLQHIAEASPVGMFSVTDTGIILEGNDRFFDITGLRRDELTEISWEAVYTPNSMALIRENCAKLHNEGAKWSAELELLKPGKDPATGETIENWVLANCSPEFDKDGAVKSIIGSITDITLQKRSAKQRLEEAEETRRQQNNFIDITSQ